MQDARVRAALLIVCLACLLGSGFVLLAGHRPAPPPVVITPPPTETTSPTPAPAVQAAPKPAGRIYVDVAGAVRRPSLYVLSSDSRVMQAIFAAGGPTSEANLDAVNLAQKVTDGEKVFVPKRTAASPQTEASSPPSVPGDPAPAPSKTAAKAGSKGRAGHSNKITAESGEQVPLNTATEEQLERLPGVGPSMAERILAYRQQAGGFGKIEDLRMVTGIGPKKYAKIAPCVTLN